MLQTLDAWMCMFIKNMAFLRIVFFLGCMICVGAWHGVEVWSVLKHMADRSDLRQQQILNLLMQDSIWDHILLLLGMAALTLQKLSFTGFGNKVEIGGEDNHT